MRFIFVLFCSVISIGLQSQLSIDIDELDIITPKTYLVSKTDQEIMIDGIASESAWQRANYTENFIDIEGFDEPKFISKVKMLWDETHLYVYAYLEEDHIWGTITEHDAIIFHDNDFEVFIDPKDDGRNYSEIEVNALNTVWDLILNRPYRLGGKANDYHEIKGLRTAVHVEGSLNDAKDDDQYWAVEMAIPTQAVLLALHSNKKTIKHGDCWRINFSRVQWDHELKDGIYSRKRDGAGFKNEMNWVWSPHGEINMHIPELWAYVYFVENGQAFRINPKKRIKIEAKELLFALFRQFKFGDLKSIISNADFDTLSITDLSYKSKEYSALINKTFKGFEIVLKHHGSGLTYIVDEEGDFIFKRS